MTWLLWALVVPVGLALALLAPRIRLTAEFAPGTWRLDLSNVWFGVKAGTGRRAAARVLFFRLRGSGDLSASEPAPASPDAEPRKAPPTPPPAAGAAPPPEEPTPQPARRKRVRRGRHRVHRERRETWRWVKSLWGERDLALVVLGRLVTLTRRLVTSCRVEQLHASLTVAFADPMLTAVTYGALCPLLNLNRIRQVQLNVGVDFLSGRTAGEGACAVSVSPLRAWWVMLTTLASLPWLRIYRVYRRLKRKPADIHPSRLQDAPVAD